MNTPTASPIVIIALTLLGVIIFNTFLIMRVKSRNANLERKMLSDFNQAIRSTWKNSDTEYDELSDLLNKAQDSSAAHSTKHSGEEAERNND